MPPILANVSHCTPYWPGGIALVPPLLGRAQLHRTCKLATRFEHGLQNSRNAIKLKNSDVLYVATEGTGKSLMNVSHGKLIQKLQCKSISTALPDATQARSMQASGGTSGDSIPAFMMGMHAMYALNMVRLQTVMIGVYICASKHTVKKPI